MAAAEARGNNLTDDDLTDDDLQSEIELVGDLVVAATSSVGPMPQDEIDRLLGVHPDEAEPEADEGGSGAGKGGSEPDVEG